VHQLVTTPAEDRAAHGGHALDCPVLRVLAQELVDVRVVLFHAPQELQRVGVGLDRKIVEKLDDADVPGLELVAESQRSFSGLSTRCHDVGVTRG
jgi:hypothetical protein